MSFNCTEQRKQDLMQLIERVVPVVPLVQGLKKSEKEKEALENQIQELEEKLEALEANIQDGNDEMNEYLRYAGSVGFGDEELLRELLSRASQPDCTDDEFHVILIVILNSSFYEVPVAEIAEEYSEQVEDEQRKFVLQNFSTYDAEEILELLNDDT